MQKKKTKEFFCEIPVAKIIMGTEKHHCVVFDHELIFKGKMFKEKEDYSKIVRPDKSDERFK